jgi:hypothetical protein
MTQYLHKKVVSHYIYVTQIRQFLQSNLELQIGYQDFFKNNTDKDNFANIVKNY